MMCKQRLNDKVSAAANNSIRFVFLCSLWDRWKITAPVACSSIDNFVCTFTSRCNEKPKFTLKFCSIYTVTRERINARSGASFRIVRLISLCFVDCRKVIGRQASNRHIICIGPDEKWVFPVERVCVCVSTHERFYSCVCRFVHFGQFMF